MRKDSARRKFLKSAGAITAIGLAGCMGGGDGGSDGGGGDETTEGSGDGSGDSDGGGTTSMSSGEDIVIAEAAPLTGNIAPWGNIHLEGLQYAIDEVNANGGVLGRNLSVVSQDTQGQPQQAATAIRRMVDNNDAVAATGTVLSNVAIRGRQVAEELEIPHLPAQGASPALLTRDTRYTFRVGGAPTPGYVKGAASLIQELGHDVYEAIIADYAYGQSYRSGITEFIQPLDGLQSNVQTAPVGASEFSSYLRQMSSDVQYLDAGGHPVGVFSIIQQADELGLNPEIAGAPNLPTPVFYETLGELMEEGLTMFSTIDSESDAFVEVSTQFAEDTGQLFDHFHGFGYATGKLLAAAIEDAGSADPTAIRDAISDIEFESILAYPISYTEWGELENARLTGTQFSLGAPDYAPDANYGFETALRTEPLEPMEPQG